MLKLENIILAIFIMAVYFIGFPLAFFSLFHPCPYITYPIVYEDFSGIAVMILLFPFTYALFIINPESRMRLWVFVTVLLLVCAAFFSIFSIQASCIFPSSPPYGAGLLSTLNTIHETAVIVLYIMGLIFAVRFWFLARE